MRAHQAARASRRGPVLRELGLAILLGLALAACRDANAYDRDTYALTGGGRSGEGARLMRAYGCGSCHTIPGVTGADATVGPNLAGIAGRAYIAGVLPNTPTNMVTWIVDPPGVDSLTAMPNLHVSAANARDIAAYLYTLR